MSIQIEKVTKPMMLGEAPHWCTERKCLYFVDILAKTINRYNPATKEIFTAQLDKQASLIVPVFGTKDEFVITQCSDLVRIKWDGVSSSVTHLETLVQEPTGLNEEAINFNDGKADPTGRLWAGTMRMAKPEIGGVESNGGNLYSWSRKEGLKHHATDISIANGLAWSQDCKTMYYIDSLQFRIDAYDCDINKPALSNRRSAIDFEKGNGLADGMTMDENGNIWVAIFADYKVLNVDPRTGEVLKTVTMPVPQPTSLAFGGPNLDELYVTSANHRLTEEEQKAYPDSGATYRITGLGVKGLAGTAVKL